MAIQKNKILANGASGNYWKITSLSIDTLTREATYEISLFTDSSYANTMSLDYVKIYEFVLDEVDLITDLISLGYTKIKAKAESLVPTGDFPNIVMVEYDSDISGGLLV